MTNPERRTMFNLKRPETMEKPRVQLDSTTNTTHTIMLNGKRAGYILDFDGVLYLSTWGNESTQRYTREDLDEISAIMTKLAIDEK